MGPEQGAEAVLLLQRKLGRGDCERWRTVLRARPAQAPQIDELVQRVRAIDPQVRWRITTSYGKVLCYER